MRFCRLVFSSTTPQEWLQFSQYNVARAQQAMQVSQEMREEMSLTRAQVLSSDMQISYSCNLSSFVANLYYNLIPTVR